MYRTIIIGCDGTEREAGAIALDCNLLITGSRGHGAGHRGLVGAGVAR